MSETTTKGTLSVLGNDNKGPSKDDTLGVRCFLEQGRASPFGVQWRDLGKRKTEFFPTEQARDRRAVQLRKDKKAGSLAITLSRPEVEEYRAIKQILGETTVSELGAIMEKFRTDMPKTRTLLEVKIAEILKIYDAARLRPADEDGLHLAADTFRQKRHKLELLKEDFGTRFMEDLESEELREWIDDLVGEVGSTANNWRKILRAFWNDTKVTPNPFSEMQGWEEGEEEVGVLTVEQTRTFFEHVEKHEPVALPRFALEAFAGLRYGSAMRIEAKDINFEDKGILLPAHKLKTRRRHYIDGLPENLWYWLRKATPETWTITTHDYMHLKSRMFKEAQVPHPRNCFRHSFASYHVAAFKRPGLVATLLCHKDQDMLWGHYKGVAKSSDGREYFKIVPSDFPKKERHLLEKDFSEQVS